jgi:hypothetical protein
MSPSLVIALTGLIFLASFSACLFLFIIVRRVVLNRQRARFEKVYQLIEGDILEVISAASPALSLRVAEKYKSCPHVLTKILLDYGQAITGEGRDQLRIIFDRTVKHSCLRSLASWRTVKRLQNARLFIIFFDPPESAVLFRLLHDKPIVKLAVINALARIPTPETFGYIFQAFEEDTGAAVQSYFNIMFSLGDRIEPLVRSSLKKNLPAEKLGLLIELVGAIPLRSLYEDVVGLAGHPDKEIRIRVARALGRLLVPESVTALKALAAEKAWEVKAQAVKSLGKLRILETADILVESLRSPHWHVRRNAAYGLAEMGEEGLRRLREVAAGAENKFARDMSVMVLDDLTILSEAA